VTQRARLKPWMLVSAVWIWPAVFGVIENVGQARLNGWEPASAGQLIWGAGDWLAYAIVTPAIFWISGRWPIVRPDILRRGLVHLGWALLFCLVWAVVGKLLQLLIMSVAAPEQVRTAIDTAGPNLGRMVAVNVASWILTTLPFGVVVYATVAGMAHAIGYFDEARRRELQVARMTEQLATARFAALQAQVNPHFLFNTLNTINVLVRDGDRMGAVRIVEQLSELLRRTLRRHRDNEVPLGEELDLVAQYLAIEEARFSDRLRPVIDVPDELRVAAVPGFAVQHLVENAIRHGVARRAAASASSDSRRASRGRRPPGPWAGRSRGPPRRSPRRAGEGARGTSSAPAARPRATAATSARRRRTGVPPRSRRPTDGRCRRDTSPPTTAGIARGKYAPRRGRS
jgi:hypothetical protein